MKNIIRPLFILALFAMVLINPRNAAAYDGVLTGDSYLFWGGYNGGQKPFSHVDDQSGAFTYSYPLEIPAGRNGMQPSLELDYNSNNLADGSQVGYGWSLSLPSIERFNKNGLETLYDETTFTSSLAGELQTDSVGSGGVGTYLPKVATPGYLKFEYLSGGSWEATDSKGVVYTFGTSSSSQLVDPSDSTHVYRWYISSIKDKNNNEVVFSYSKDGNQVYPSNINYTKNGSSTGLFDVAFTLEDRDDDTVKHETGFPVTTAKRISRIEAQVGSIIRKKFDLNYINGENGKRSLLEEVITTAYDEDLNATVLPPLTMTHNGGPEQWQGVSGTYPLSVLSTGLGNMHFADVNGDGLVDTVEAFQTFGHTPDYTTKKVHLNNGITWDEDTAWASTITVPFTNYANAIMGNNPAYDLCEQLVDVNGDALPDLVYSNQYTWLDPSGNPYQEGVYMNTGSGWASSPSWTVPVDICNYDNDLGARFVDVNGDGLVDIVQSYDTDTPPIEEKGVYLNTGSGWVEDTSWTVPLTFALPNGFDKGVRVADINNDGLADIIQSLMKDADGNPNNWQSSSAYVDTHVYINHGGGWTEDTNWDIPSQITDTFIFAFDYYSCTSCSPNDYKTRLADMNGDGLVDLIDLDASPPFANMRGVVAYNTGTSWVPDTSQFILPTEIFSGNCRYPEVVLDVNGDGLDDFLNPGTSACSGMNFVKSYVSTGVGYDSGTPGAQYNFPADVVDNIVTPSGATYDVRYKPAVEYLDGSSDPANPDLPFPKMTMESLSIDDGFGNISTSSYSYEGGSYYYADEDDRKFAGFNRITMTDELGNVTVDYFHQGNSTDSSNGESTDDVSKIGQRYREEVYDDNGHLYQTTIDSWTNTALGSDGDFVYRNQSLELLYDADSDHKDKATSYTFDTTTGNLTEEKRWGKVTGSTNGTFTDTDNDTQKTSISYADWSTGGTSGYKSIETLKNNGDTRVQETKWKYDGLAPGLVSTGNATRESHWIVGASTYAQTDFTYDSYGLVATKIDPMNHTTTYTPDTYHLYPASITEPYSQVTAYVYDYASGKPTQVTDKNTFVSQMDYDGFGRPLAERHPDPATPTSLLTTKTYAYTDTFPAVVHETNNFSSSIAKDSYTYFDGLGRPIQRRQEAEGSNTYNVTDTKYDERGDVKSVSLPYSSSGSSRTSATSTTDLYETTTYDTLHRPTSVVNAAGTDSTSYEDWVATETDREGKIKDYGYNAHGQLVSVTEHAGTNSMTTTYNINPAGWLMKITDANDNIRSFTYDGQGNRLTAEDLHDPADTTFGSWSYTYDAAGNMLTSVNPNSITTTYTYDNQNRVLNENITSTTGKDIIYDYDSCTNGVGKLCTATLLNSPVTSYTYDALGRVATEAKKITGTTYTTSYAYDRQNNTALLTYPDGSTTVYNLDTDGSIDSVGFDDAHTTGVQTIASGITYGPHGKVTAATYGNSVASTWSYDAAELYRLDNKTTTSGSTTLEDFDYDYDGVGNLSTLTDASSLYANMSIAYTYGDLHRLTSATSTSTDSALAYTNNWTYNPIGNIVTSTDKGLYKYLGTASGNYANPHAATLIGSTAITYDNNGNVLTDGTWTNTWDYRNQLATSTNGTTTITYKYDHAGNRVKQSGGASTIVYPNSNYTIDGTKVMRHIPAGPLGNAATSTWNGTTATVVYHHNDHLGGTHVETDSAGASIEYIIYKPFGGTLVDVKAGSYGNNFKYTGKEKDQNTGWYYYGARYYNADTGQFMSEDPVFLNAEARLDDPQASNAYAYARNNPLIYRDPDGRAFGVDDALGGIIGGAVGTIGHTIVSLATGTKITAGGIAGAAVSGAILGVGAVNTPETLGASNAVALGVVLGAGAGAAGNATKQTIDIGTKAQTSGFNTKELVADAVFGGVTGGIFQGVVPVAAIPGLSSGRNNMNAIRGSMLTKLANGTVKSESLTTGVKSAIGSQASDAYRTITGFGADIGRGLFGSGSSSKKTTNN